MKFNIILEVDEDGRYVVECTDLPGCLSEGDTLKEAIENINEAILRKTVKDIQLGVLPGNINKDWVADTNAHKLVTNIFNLYTLHYRRFKGFMEYLNPEGSLSEYVMTYDGNLSGEENDKTFQINFHYEIIQAQSLSNVGYFEINGIRYDFSVDGSDVPSLVK